MPVPTRINRTSDFTLQTIELRAAFGDGYQQAAPNGINPIYELWSITWSPLTIIEVNTVIAAYKSVGTWGTVIWTPYLTGTAQNYNFLTAPKVTRIATSAFSVTTQMKQVF
jgi:phage-related protein